MKTKQKRNELLALQVCDDGKGNSSLAIDSESSSAEIPGLNSITHVLDIFLSTMIMMREQNEGTLRQGYMAKAPALWFFDFKRTKKAITMKICEQVLKPFGEEHHAVSLETIFKWKGDFEGFELAVEGLLRQFPKHKIFNLLGPESQDPSA